MWLDALGFEEAVSAVDALVASGRGGAVFTPNVDHVVKAERDAALREAYAAADLCLPDGQWIVWASRLLGTPLPAKVSGSDLALPLARRVSGHGASIYLLGGSPEVARDAARRLETEAGARICGIDSSRVDVSANPSDVVERVAAARPSLVLVAFGCPKQEIWIHRNRERLRPAVLVGVGGTLDFLAGRIPRAPRWISRSGLEWLFRLALEPRRLARRYLVDDPRFAAILLRTAREPRDRRTTT